MLITCWQSTVKFPGQKCLIVQACQTCHVSCGGNSDTSYTWGLKYYECVSKIYLSQKASLGNEYIYSHQIYIYIYIHTICMVWWVCNCSIYNPVISNYQMSNKGLAYLASLFTHPRPGSPHCYIRLCWILCNCPHELNFPPTLLRKASFLQPTLFLLPTASFAFAWEILTKLIWEQKAWVHMGILW